MYIMPNNRGYEIDTMQDFEIVSHLMNNELYKKI